MIFDGRMAALAKDQPQIYVLDSATRKAYVQSGLSPHDFLRSIDHPRYADGRLHVELLDWLRSGFKNVTNTETRERWCQTLNARNNRLDLQEIRNRPNLPALLDQTSASMSASANPVFVIEPGETPTQTILRFRRMQAHADFVSAQNLRQVINRYIDVVESLIERQDTAAQVRPSDIRQIAGALRDLQSIQRVALGLPVDNVGFQLEGVDGEGKRLPQINVRLSDIIAPAVSRPTPPPEPEDVPASAPEGVVVDV